MLAGEASGDLHAAKLITALKAIEPGARFVGMGGPKMAAAGLEVAKDLEGMQVVGFWEVFKNYGFFKKVFYQLLDRVKQEKPSALICVDYPGFNLRFAKEVRKLGIPVLYYIVPQVWAWKAMRAKSMAQFVDRAYCVFEFEVPFFEKFGLKTQFVGHPLVDHKGAEAAPKFELPSGPKTVAFLPGSRVAEIQALLPPMIEGLATAIYERKMALRGLTSYPQTDVECRWPTSWKPAYCKSEDFFFAPVFVDKHGKRVVVHPDSNSQGCISILEKASEHRGAHSSLLPSLADFSVVKSGTSTLEAGLAGNPMCVVYKSSAISYAIAHQLVNIPVFSLVNIVLGKYAVPELLQNDVNPQRIAQEIERGLNDQKYRETQKAALAELPKKLGGPGASARAAKAMLNFLKGRE